MKIINNIKNFLAVLGRRIDRYVIMPMTKFAVKISDIILRDSRKFEKLLNKKSSLLIVTLFLSIVAFIAVDSKTISIAESSAEVLYNQPVTVEYNEEAYVLEGVPETVDVTLIGRNSDLYLAKQISNHEVTLDLSGLKPGTHKVALKYKRFLDTINYKLDPSVVTVTIYQKVSESRTINVDLLNKDNLDPKLVIEKTDIDRDEVIIKGSLETLAKVATVKALIDINNLVDPKVGTLELKDIPLIAYDQSGNVINVEIVPSKVNATITITSPQKKVPLKFIPVGTITFGKAISSIDSNINEVTIYGESSVIDDITSIPVNIDVNDLKESKEYNLNLEKPVGIRYMSEVVANVEVKIDNESQKEFGDINIEYENLGNNLTVNAKDVNVIAVTVKGVSSILDNLDPSTIRAYVDLKGYGVGTHTVDVIIERTDLRLNYIPKVKKVTLIIKNKQS